MIAQPNPSRTTSKAPLTRSVPAARYNKLPHSAQALLLVLDSFCPDDKTIAWGCDYDHLMRIAAESPGIDDKQLVSILGTLQHLRMVDYAVALVEDRLQIWVAPYTHRAQLRHAMVTQMIKRRRQIVDRVAAQSQTQNQNQTQDHSQTNAA